MRPTRNGLDCVTVFLFRGEFQVWRGCDEDGGGSERRVTFTLQQPERKVWK